MTDPREDALAKPITDERIERVAKALCRNAYPDRNLGEYVSPDVQIWERLKREARIALEADSKALTPSPTPYVRPAAEALEPRCYQCGGPVSGMECESCEANQNPPEEHEIIKAIVDELFELNPDCSKSTIAEVALSVVRKFLLRHPGALT